MLGIRNQGSLCWRGPAAAQQSFRVQYEISVLVLLFAVLIKVMAHRTIRDHDFLQGIGKSVQYNVSVIFMSGFKRDGKDKSGKTENLRNSQA